MNKPMGQPLQQPSLEIQIQQALRQAWMLQSAGRNAEAEAICKQIFSVRPNHPEALHLLGVIALRDGHIEVAQAALTKAVQAKPDNPQYQSNLGLAYHESGQMDAAVQHYRRALRADAAYLDAYYNLHAAELSAGQMKSAISSLQKLLGMQPADWDARFMLGVLLEWSGDPVAAVSQFAALDKAPALYGARLDAWQYLKSACPALPPILGSNIDTFRLAVDAAKVPGLVLEFGVRHGNTIRQIAALVDQKVHGFDSFEGLPEEWHHEPKGSYTTKGKIPEVPKSVKLHPGWFADTLPAFLATHEGPIRLVNIDCDIYSSTKTVLDALAPRIAPGSVII